jgi:hypothetical protein
LQRGVTAKRFRSGLKTLRAQFAKARMRARRNACAASRRQRPASPIVTENVTKYLRRRQKKIFRWSARGSADFGGGGVSLAMIRKTFIIASESEAIQSTSFSPGWIASSPFELLAMTI